MQTAAFPILVFGACLVLLAVGLLIVGFALNPRRPGQVKQMPYESGMDPVHDSRRRFDVRFHLLAIAFLVFDVELLFLYPWAVAMRPQATTAVQAGATETTIPPTTEAPVREADRAATRPVFLGGMVFLALLTLGYVYDWRKGVFRWR